MKRRLITKKTNKHFSNPIILFLFLAASHFFISCSSTQPLQEVKNENEFKNLKTTLPQLEFNKITSLQQLNQITTEGVNNQVSVAPNGLKIIYISQKKLKHDHTQIYEMNLKSKLEKRLTYQDGFIKDPIFLNENEISYASTTDAIKENPINIQKDDPLLLDVYLSDRLGNHIERITQRIGYDAQITHTQNLSQFIYFVVKKENKSWIQRFDRTSNVSVVYLQSENDLLTQPHFSSNGSQLAWLSQNQKSQKFTLQFGSLTSNHLILKKSIAYIDLPLTSINKLSWSDDLKGFWITGKTNHLLLNQVFYFSIPENCLKQVTQETIDIQDFQDIPFSQQLVIFTLSNEKNSQIFTAQRPDVSAIKCLENKVSSVQ